MAPGPLTSWQIDGKTMKTVTDFIFLVQMVTAAMKLRQLLLGRKAVTNLDSILKSRDITLLTKFCLVNATVFSVVMCGCECWTIKIAEHQSIDTFELWGWRRLIQSWVLPSNSTWFNQKHGASGSCLHLLIISYC